VEARRPVRAAIGGRWRRFADAGGLGAVLLGLALFLGAAGMDIWPLHPLPYRPGQYVASDVYSRLSFRVLSPRLLEEARQRAADTTPATFQLNAALIEDVTTTLRGLPERLKAATQPAELDEDLAGQFGIDTPAALAAWRRYAEPEARKAYLASVDRLAEDLAGRCILAYEEFEAHRQRSRLILRHGERVSEKEIADLITLKNRRGVDAELAEAVRVLDPAIQSHVRRYLQAAVMDAARPTYRHDAAATGRDVARAVAALDAHPPDETYQHYQAGTVLVRASRRQGPEGETAAALTEDEWELLRAEHEAYWGDLRATRPWLVWGQIGGRAATVLLMTAVLCGYVWRQRAGILRSRWQAFALVVVALAALLVAKLTAHALQWNPYTVLLPILLAGTIVSIAHGQRLALAIGTVLAVLVALQLRAGLGLLAVLLAALATSVYQLREIRTRSKLIRVAAVAAGVVAVAVAAQGMARAVQWRFVLIDCAWGAGFALLAGLLTEATLPLIERAFRVATSMTLLEWCDASKPLLKRMAAEAPGTFNHSLQLGTICEAAAEAIGAKGLLARAGAYYHDIGKTNKPPYFVENQAGGSSLHEKLSPAMSLLIIIGHVKDGLEMARQYGLPAVLHEFIATHHGTTLVQYFYSAAAEKSRAESERQPDETEFRYPGPKPRSKEAAILMLADAAESSLRAVAEPTPGRIESQVHTMVTRRLMDGQLDECELTLKEVHQIEESLTRSLCGIYHSRIAYPAPAGEAPSAAETSRADKPARARAEK